MTQKHFRALAEALNHAKPIYHDLPLYLAGAQAQWRGDVERVANVCELVNARFDRLKFYEACGYEVQREASHAKA